MKAEFDIVMTPQAMRDYRFYHKYTRFSGIMELVLGVFLLALGGACAGRANASYVLMVAFIGLFFLVIMPVSMAMRAASTVKKSPRFQAPTHYVITEEKMVLSMGELSQEVSWDQIYRIRETKISLLVYFSPYSANVLPKNQLGGQLAAVKEIFVKGMGPYKALLKAERQPRI